MYVTSVTQSEIRLTLEVSIEMVNALRGERPQTRKALTEAGFSGAAEASEVSIQRVQSRLSDLLPIFAGLVSHTQSELAQQVNAELARLPISPAMVDHDGVGPHIHWTPTSATFDDRIISDILMALAQELCDNDTTRFGQCAADDCDDLFYDSTRNHSRRFCSDPRCANRTHTADHRARQRTTHSEA